MLFVIKAFVVKIMLKCELRALRWFIGINDHKNVTLQK